MSPGTLPRSSAPDGPDDPRTLARAAPAGSTADDPRRVRRGPSLRSPVDTEGGTRPEGGLAELQARIGADVGRLLAGLPDGVVEAAMVGWRAGEVVADRAGLAPSRPGDDELRHVIELELTAPLLLEDWPPPAVPVPVTGGWIHEEVVDDDRPVLDAVLDRWSDDGPEAVAAAAQELRLPVTPYRRPTRADPDPLCVTDPTEPGGPAEPVSTPTPTPPPMTGRAARPVRVVDLSTHWAGPLATALLARAGAEVVKVDPAVRPDGFRRRPALYQHLNGAKDVVDLDLRVDGDRRRFEVLIADADLLVSSFSRRVLPNLGYDRATLARHNPTLVTVAVRAFPTGSPEVDWLAYGPGVHAASGLGLLGPRPEPPPVAYPDLVAGFAAYGAAMAALAEPARGPGRGPTRPTAVEVSLAGAIAPLAAPTMAGDDAGHG